MKRRFIGLILILWLLTPSYLHAFGIPVFDLAKWVQDLGEYALDALRFSEEMVRLYEELRILSDQLHRMDEVKQFTDDFMELYRFTLEMLDSGELNKIIGEQSPLSYDSPPVSKVMGELAGKDAEEYQKIIEATTEFENVEEVKKSFSKVYWDLSEIRTYIEKAFPDDKDSTRKFLEAQSKALGVIEAKKISADATVSRIRSMVRSYINQVIPENERVVKEAANNITKISQAQAAGIVNLQKMETQQLLLFSKGLELLSELLVDKAKEKAEVIKNIMEEREITGRFKRTDDEYVTQVKSLINETSKALLDILTTSKWEKED